MAWSVYEVLNVGEMLSSQYFEYEKKLKLSRFAQEGAPLLPHPPPDGRGGYLQPHCIYRIT